MLEGLVQKLTIPGMPPWVALVLMVAIAVSILAFLAMPFAVFGVKSRLEAIEAELADLRMELRNLVLTGPGAAAARAPVEVDYVAPPMRARRPPGRRRTPHRPAGATAGGEARGARLPRGTAARLAESGQGGVTGGVSPGRAMPLARQAVQGAPHQRPGGVAAYPSGAGRQTRAATRPCHTNAGSRCGTHAGRPMTISKGRRPLVGWSGGAYPLVLNKNSLRSECWRCLPRGLASPTSPRCRRIRYRRAVFSRSGHLQHRASEPNGTARKPGRELVLTPRSCVAPGPQKGAGPEMSGEDCLATYAPRSID